MIFVYEYIRFMVLAHINVGRVVQTNFFKNIGFGGGMLMISKLYEKLRDKAPSYIKRVFEGEILSSSCELREKAPPPTPATAVAKNDLEPSLAESSPYLAQ